LIYVYSLTGPTLLFTAEGEQASAQLGFTVHGVSDYNNDGNADLAAGSPRYKALSLTDSGKIYVYSGKTDGLLFTKTGEAVNAKLGTSISSADVNNDDRVDLIIGAPGHTESQITEGQIYVYSSVDNSLIFKKTGGVAGAFFGSAVSGLKDINGDSNDEIIASSPYTLTTGPGQVFVLSGADGTPLYSKQGLTTGSLFGASVADTFDMNKDGTHDFIVGSPYSFNSENLNVGRAVLYSGKGGAKLVSIEGKQANGGFGLMVKGVGNLGDQTRNNMLLASPLFDVNSSTNHGQLFIYSLGE
jgi:hypothetical protein